MSTPDRPRRLRRQPQLRLHSDSHLCVVVISAAPHAHLLPRVVRSVLSSTLLPSRLVVALSGVNGEICAAANHSVGTPLLEMTAPSIAFRLLCSERRHSSGQNRNRGQAACRWDDNTTGATSTSASASADESFVSFIDSDDLLMPTRLERITSLMREHKADLGLHSYVGAVGCCQSPPRIIRPEAAAALYAAMPQCGRVGFHSDCDFRGLPSASASLTCRAHDSCDTSRCAHTSGCVHFLPGSLSRVHYAHSTARASVFRTLKQREGAAYGKVEDSWFARDMAALGMRHAR